MNEGSHGGGEISEGGQNISFEQWYAILVQCCVDNQQQLDPVNNIDHRNLVQFLHANPDMIPRVQDTLEDLLQSTLGDDLPSSTDGSTTASCSRSGSKLQSFSSSRAESSASSRAQAPSSGGQPGVIGEATGSIADSQNGADSPKRTDSASSEPPDDAWEEAPEPTPRGGRGGSANATTLVVQNVPSSYVQEDLLDLWPADGMDFLHFRPRCSTMSQKNVAVINFLSPDYARLFREQWNGLVLPGGGSKKLAITPAQVQGRDANLMLLLSTDVPTLFHGGRRLRDSEALAVVRLSKSGIFFCAL